MNKNDKLDPFSFLMYLLLFKVLIFKNALAQLIFFTVVLYKNNIAF